MIILLFWIMEWFLGYGFALSVGERSRHFSQQSHIELFISLIYLLCWRVRSIFALS